MDSMEHIKKLKIDGWTYNPDVEDKLGSIFFDRDGNEDNYLRITPLKNNQNTYIFTITVGCEDTEVYISVVPPDDDVTLLNTATWIKKELKKYED